MPSDDLFVALFFLANTLFCIAYLVRDMAWLRGITILAAASTLPYFYVQDSPLYSAMGWQVAFILINTYNLTILLMERRPVVLSPDQQRLHALTFRRLSPREMLKILRIAEWHDVGPDEHLVRQGDEMRSLYLIFDGQAEVRTDGGFRANLGPGDFIGEMSVATDTTASADVITRTPVRYVRWDRQALAQLYLRHPELKDHMLSILGIDMAQKLARG